MILSEQDKKVIVMRSHGETLEAIAKELNITVEDCTLVFRHVAEQTTTAEDTVEIMTLINTFPYRQTRSKQRKILDGIGKDNLVEYATQFYPDECREALLK